MDDTPSKTRDHPPAHHRPEGGFRNPWGELEHGLGDFLRWRRERSLAARPVDPPRGSLPRATPEFATPRAARGRLSVTWVGHSTLLLQMGTKNILTDPMWSEYAAPLPGLGPRRWAPPGIDLETLPPIDIVLQSHDHYDHLDDRTVRRIAVAHPRAQWVTTLGLARWIAGRGVARVTELDWWAAIEIDGLEITCAPAQHFSGRGLFDRWRTLWASFAIRAGDQRVYFGGDSGYHPEYTAIGERLGPFDLTLLPIGAYDPRWFMRVVHMDPEEAVRAFRDLNARPTNGHHPVMVPMHWGTFKLTDEPLLEPPARARAEWERTGGSPDDLWILPHGGTRWR
jgi:N-acyl-phosphatidylethanolamine-hydrolysing phospholipase D